MSLAVPGGALGAGAYALGLLQLGAVLLAAALSARSLLSRTHLTGGPRVVAFGLLGAGAVVAAELLPLAFGVLSRGTVLVAAALVLALSWAVSRRLPVPSGTPERPPADGVGVLARTGAVICGAFWLAAMEVLAQQHVSSVDALAFHLPGVVGYLQSQSLWHLTQFIPGQAQANYPQYGDLLLLATVVPIHSLALVRYVDPILLGLASLAAFEATSEMGVPRRTAAVLTLAVFSLRPLLGTAIPDSLVDPSFMLGFCAGLLFLARARRTESRVDLLLGAAGLALALGSKWYGLEDVPLLVLCWAVWARPGWRRFGLLVAAVAVLGGIWLVRNWVLTGDPVFDEPVRILGVTIFAAPYSAVQHQIGYSLAHYAAHPTILRLYVWPVFRSAFGIVGAVLVVGAVLGRRPWFASVAALLCLIAYAVTPYTALGFPGHPVGVADNTRYAVPALILLLPACGLALARLGALSRIVELGLVIVAVINVRDLLSMAFGRVLLAALILVVIATLWEVRPVLWLAAAAAVVIGFHYQRVLAATPWEPDDPTVAALAGAHDTRIGVAGTWTAAGTELPAPLYGARLTNAVIALGPWRDHRLEAYTTRAGFQSAIRRARVTFIEVGNGIPPVADNRYVRWAQSAGYRVITRSPRLTLLGGPGFGDAYRR